MEFFKADQKLAAGRLLREVQALRSRLNSLEKKLIAETRVNIISKHASYQLLTFLYN